jgi:Domain of unknown function (DUF927)
MYANDDLLPKLQGLGHYRSAIGPSKAFQKPTSMAANARAGLAARPRDFALVANNCAQARRSLTEHGEHDGRQLWHALLTLVFFCENARDWSHEIGNLHPAYDEAETDAEVDRVAAEHAKKPFGATLCTTFDAERPGVCAACPHFGKVTSPYQLGIASVASSPSDLPPGFRRHNGWIERQTASEDWRRVVQGDIGDPLLEESENRRRLTFTFTRSDRVAVTVAVYQDEPNYRNGRELFSLRGIDLNMYNYKSFVDLVLAWIDQLLAACQLRNESLPSFGWADTGFAVGGVFYAADGSETPALGADPALLRRYEPRGSLAQWQKAANFVAADVPALHAAIATSFGAPLLAFSGESGGCIAFVGPSGVGKTSAFIAGAAVWGDPRHTMISLDDTSNYQTLVLGQTRALPIYWDEAKLATKERQAELVNMLHKLTQGRDKGRLTADIAMREAGEWNTIFPLSTNNSVTELVAAQEGHKTATMVRVLEIEIERQGMQALAGAALTVAGMQRNYGHAGQVYARYIAQHAPQIEAMVTKTKQLVMDQTSPYETEERFYVALASSILVGAKLARDLKLIDLDIKGIARVLCDAIKASRIERRRYEPKDPIEVLVQQLDRFCNAHADACVVTAHLARRGPQALANEKREKLPVKIDRPAPAYQIAVADGVIRIEREAFTAWCNKKGLPGSKMIKDMIEVWGGIEGRGPIGGGTAYPGGRVYFFQIPLSNPDLSHMLDEFPEYATTGSGKPGQKIVPLRLRGSVSGPTPTP